jgi:hypothetical protein
MITGFHVLDDNSVLCYNDTTSTATEFSGIYRFDRTTKTGQMIFGTIGTTNIGGYRWDRCQKVGNSAATNGYLIGSSQNSNGLLFYRWNTTVQEVVLVTGSENATTRLGVGSFDVFNPVGTDGDFFVSSGRTDAQGNVGLWFYDRSDNTLGTNRNGRVLATAIQTTGAYATFYTFGTGTTQRWLAIPGTRTGTTNSNAIGRFVVFQQNQNSGLPVPATVPATLPTATQFYRIAVPINSTETNTRSNANCMLFIGEGLGVMMYDHNMTVSNAATLAGTIRHPYTTGSFNRFYEFNNIERIPTPSTVQAQNRGIVMWHDTTPQANGVVHYNPFTMTVTNKITFNGCWGHVHETARDDVILLHMGNPVTHTGENGFVTVNNSTTRGADTTKTATHHPINGRDWAPVRVGTNAWLFSSRINGTASGIVCWNASLTNPTCTQTIASVGASHGAFWIDFVTTNENLQIEDCILSSSFSGTNNSGMMRFNGETLTTERIPGTSGNSSFSIQRGVNAFAVPGGILLACNTNSWTASFQRVTFYDITTRSTTLTNITTTTNVNNWGGFLEFPVHVMIMRNNINERPLIWHKARRELAEVTIPTDITGTWNIAKTKSSNEWILISRAALTRGYIIFTDSPITFTRLTDASISETSHTGLEVPNGTLWYPNTNIKSWMINLETEVFKDLGNLGTGLSGAVIRDMGDDTLIVVTESLAVFRYNKVTDVAVAIDPVTAAASAGLVPVVTSIDVGGIEILQCGINSNDTIRPKFVKPDGNRLFLAITETTRNQNVVRVVHDGMLYLSNGLATVNSGLFRIDPIANISRRVLFNGNNYRSLFVNEDDVGVIMSNDVSQVRVFSFNTALRTNDIYFTGQNDAGMHYIVTRGLVQKLRTGRFKTFNEEFTPSTFVSSCITGANGRMVGTSNIIARVLGPEDEFITGTD